MLIFEIIYLLQEYFDFFFNLLSIVYFGKSRNNVFFIFFNEWIDLQNIYITCFSKKLSHLEFLYILKMDLEQHFDENF